jgi:glucose/arabinose dehydrogenase
VHVTATGSLCTLSRASAPLGTMRFLVENRGRAVHQFSIDGRKTAVLQPRGRAVLNLQLSKPGALPYSCAAPSRVGAGMKGVFRATEPPSRSSAVEPTLTQIASGLPPLTDVAVAPDDPARLFAVEQDGKVVMLDGGAQQVVADFGGYIRDDGENGLLAMTFSPSFAEDRTAYFYFTDDMGNGSDTLVAAAVGDDWTVDIGSLRLLLQVETPGANHRGGDIAFGPDGYLYVPIGDGDNGTYTVIGQYAQDPSSLLGGIVRVDPSTGSVQLWAKGLRNPWRDYIDATTGLYYIGDVGENDQEEIDVVPLGDRGFNFGWPCVEGTEVHADTQVQCPDESQLTAPVLTYSHEGRCAVIAGVVVHDPRLVSLDGSFLYSDLCDGELRTFVDANGAAVDVRDLGLKVGQPTAFGEGPDGRVYVATGEGDVYRLDPAP